MEGNYTDTDYSASPHEIASLSYKSAPAEGNMAQSSEGRMHANEAMGASQLSTIFYQKQYYFNLESKVYFALDY